VIAYVNQAIQKGPGRQDYGPRCEPSRVDEFNANYSTVLDKQFDNFRLLQVKIRRSLEK